MVGVRAWRTTTSEVSASSTTRQRLRNLVSLFGTLQHNLGGSGLPPLPAMPMSGGDLEQGDLDGG